MHDTKNNGWHLLQTILSGGNIFFILQNSKILVISLHKK